MAVLVTAFARSLDAFVDRLASTAVLWNAAQVLHSLFGMFPPRVVFLMSRLSFSGGRKLIEVWICFDDRVQSFAGVRSH